MKALTLMQPWASLIACNAKCLETRSWNTTYRGELLIHASAKFAPEHRQMAYHTEPFRRVLSAAHLIPTQATGMVEEFMPLGSFVARAELAGTLRTEFVKSCYDLNRALEFTYKGVSFDWTISNDEIAFGDFTPGRWAFVLVEVQPVTPLRARGALGLWNYAGPLPEVMHE